MKLIERVVHAVLDYVYHQSIIQSSIQSWKARYIQDPLPQLPESSMPVTGEIDEHALKSALRTREEAMQRKVEMADVVVGKLPTGAYTRWYRDEHMGIPDAQARKHRAVH